MRTQNNLGVKMKKFIIISDSSCGLEKELRDKYDIQYLPMYYCFDGKTIPASNDWEEISAKEFYDMMRQGTRFTTAQVTPSSYKEAFERAINDGYDVLSISCPAVISNGVNSSMIVRDELLKKHPESKIICIDAYSCCFGLGLLCIEASKMRSAGKTIEETAEWVINNRDRFHQEGSVSTLEYLKRAGRVSAAKAFFGGLLNVKPIIMCDVKGRNAVVEKVKGRKASLDRIVERFKERYIAGVCDYIFISHADCLEDAETVKNMIRDQIGDDPVEIKIGYVVSPIGATVGPGMIGVYFYGEQITHDGAID